MIWEALTTLACCDRAVIVCLEAIRGLVGAPFPTVSKLPPPGSKKVRAAEQTLIAPSARAAVGVQPQLAAPLRA